MRMMTNAVFRDRADAGRRLAARLDHVRDDDVVVVGLPRGGVPVAYEIADYLEAPLDVILVRKLGVPMQPELAMGALGEDGVRVINDTVIDAARITKWELERVEQRERLELQRRATRYRAHGSRIPLQGRVVVVVDDGIATGSTAQAACRVVRSHGAKQIVLAVPVAPAGWNTRHRYDADECIALENPTRFSAISQWYNDFSQTSDEEVVELLQRRNAAIDNGAPVNDASSQVVRRSVEVPVGLTRLPGDLAIPENATGLVIFAHGSGSSRHSPRNRSVADALNRSGLATLLFDLLTSREERDRSKVFDIALLAHRLVAAIRWGSTQPALENLPIGLFGASTGAAAALWASTEPDGSVAAIVARGGRPDLASDRLAQVNAPTLLIVGGDDDVVLGFNRRSRDVLTCENDLVIIERSGHLFEEPGALRKVAEAACQWFKRHFEMAIQ